ncbi:hypothetical protein IQ226_16215 [Dolichospermum sp. LEGE 00240]|uniref:hypothetical protein n=1 Tax=Dolichospermum sp. LEGE 00240 TaxID=1828603 RepID=UPI00187E17E3|nr:hypothetical protein [Dolichospermum sp. LEGE 00240]MBE9250653.1 hypothetical protein [Dolichospermum sp. LEGE 00240]MDM3862708.1 hypothetical protein [Aphanizomenon gracile PMC644.10]
MKPNNRSQYCIRNVIAPPTPQKAIAPPHPKRDRPPTSPNSELLAAALRYRPPHLQTANCLQQRFAIAPHISKQRSHLFSNMEWE